MAQLKATDFNGLEELLVGCIAHETRKIGHNTTAERYWDNDIVTSSNKRILIRLHGHPIVSLHPDGHIAISLAGYPTVTTRDRVNQFIGRNRVFQKNHEQFLTIGEDTLEMSSNHWYLVHEGEL